MNSGGHTNERCSSGQRGSASYSSNGNRNARRPANGSKSAGEALERPLPQNTDAERSVLGAILLDNHTLNVALEKLKPEDFFDDRHRRIFNHMIQLGQQQRSIDLVTLTDDLRCGSDLEASGGAAYVAQLVDGVPRVSNLEHYARIVKEKSLLRSIAYSMHAIKEAAIEGTEDSADIADRARLALATLDASRQHSWREMFHTYQEFENAAPLTFSIKGFLQNNGATLIGGLSGHGKTLLMLSMVKALLSGEGAQLWNYFDVEETADRILYLIPESAIEPFKHRLQLFSLYKYLEPLGERLFVRTLSKGPTPCLSDPRILQAAKGAHVYLDTAVRFSAEGDENSAGDNQRGLAADIFALLGAGARSIIGAHHSPKPFAKESVMRLENVLRGSGDIGAMVVTAWGIKQIDASANIIHVENIKPRDFAPPAPFQLIGRPYISEEGDFRLHKSPGMCGSLANEQDPDQPRGGAKAEAREARARNIQLLKSWLAEDPNQTSDQLSERFKAKGIDVSPATVRKYKTELSK